MPWASNVARFAQLFPESRHAGAYGTTATRFSTAVTPGALTRRVRDPLLNVFRRDTRLNDNVIEHPADTSEMLHRPLGSDPLKHPLHVPRQCDVAPADRDAQAGSLLVTLQGLERILIVIVRASASPSKLRSLRLVGNSYADHPGKEVGTNGRCLVSHGRGRRAPGSLEEGAHLSTPRASRSPRRG